MSITNISFIDPGERYSTYLLRYLHIYLDCAAPTSQVYTIFQVLRAHYHFPDRESESNIRISWWYWCMSRIAFSFLPLDSPPLPLLLVYPASQPKSQCQTFHRHVQSFPTRLSACTSGFHAYFGESSNYPTWGYLPLNYLEAGFATPSTVQPQTNL